MLPTCFRALPARRWEARPSITGWDQPATPLWLSFNSLITLGALDTMELGSLFLGVSLVFQEGLKHRFTHSWCHHGHNAPTSMQQTANDIAHSPDLLHQKSQMSDSYGQCKLSDEKPNCFAYVQNEIRAFLPMKKSLYLICQSIWSYKFKLMVESQIQLNLSKLKTLSFSSYLTQILSKCINHKILKVALYELYTLAF